ncbi:tRNA(Met) cytidine acetyltransferase [Thiorhodococcus minor]|uniref:tRNA(Met) cytidine acetyltransferase TmcA n=1 Tax=Thiorhodococcus minor TaxID=57489 RepID=A0A6M0JUE7_9GAMM|nr:tRNA(Met) cytidine acetyltransferase [Thiorhodococcus minor]
MGEALRRRLREAGPLGHRLCILVSGSPAWIQASVIALIGALPDPQPVWLTDQPGKCKDRLPLRSATALLGQDIPLLIYDAQSGFDPDGFAAASGAIVGGGVLILMTPPLDPWPRLPDPQAERIAVWPHSAPDLSGRFIERLVRVLRADPRVLHLDQSGGALSDTPVLARDAQPSPTDPEPPRPAERHANRLTQPCTRDQAEAVEAVIKTARGRAHRPLVIKAHRGRGKSAALGIAAGRLMLERDRRILVTAPSRAAVETVFRHAHAVLDSALARHGEPRQRLAFLAPADVASDVPAADLLLVDEAAGIPAPLLETLVAHYGRLVFATTIHGYEGTGRGFDIRFRQHLDRVAPDWRTLELEEPIRWGRDDPLEDLVFRMLLLDAAPAPDARVTATAPQACDCIALDRDRLARDEPLLAQVFGLLILAHYQTRPMDLRMLLDGPNIRILVARHQGLVVGALLAAREGRFTEPELRDAIFRGSRRPRGHLLPQTLSAHAGLPDATEHAYLRIVRIAVHPAAQGRGLGRQLLEAIQQQARNEDMDCLGASFGGTPELIRFWDRCGHRPVQIGCSRNAASGEHAVVSLLGISDTGADLVRRAQARLESALRTLLAGPLRGLDPGVAVALAIRLPAAGQTEGIALSQAQSRELSAFVDGDRSLTASLPLLADLTRRYLGPAVARGELDLESARLLLAAARQLRPVGELVELLQASGRGELLKRLREAARGLQRAAGALDAGASTV